MPTKPKSFADALATVREKRAVKIGALTDFDLTVHPLSTGNIAIDAITGVGGLPRGRVVELFGPPSSGKTTTALQAAAQHQARVKAGLDTGAILYFDHEKSLDLAYCRALGLDVEDSETFAYMRPRSFEEGANVFRQIIKEAPGSVAMAIWDSVAVMVTENELASETGKANVADRAKMMAQFLRQVIDIIAEQDICAVFLNHIQEVIDSSPIGQKLKAQGIKRMKTPGGEALKYHASLRVEYKQVGNLRTTTYDPLSNEKIDDIKQTKVKVTVVKNKVAPPFKTCEVRVRFGKGFSQAYSVKEILKAHAVLKEEKGGVFRLDETTAPHGWNLDKVNFIRGEEAFLSQLEIDQEWLARLSALANDLLKEHGAFVLSDDEIAAYAEELEEVDIEAV